MSELHAPVLLNVAAVTNGPVASLTSVLDVLASSNSALETFTQRFGSVLQSDGLGGFVLTDDGIDLLWRECVDVTTGGAGELVSLEFNPSDAFLELVSTIASDGHSHVVFSHGWPILSLAGDTASVTEPAGTCNGAGRGGVA